MSYGDERLFMLQQWFPYHLFYCMKAFRVFGWIQNDILRIMTNTLCIKIIILYTVFTTRNSIWLQLKLWYILVIFQDTLKDWWVPSFLSMCGWYPIVSLKLTRIIHDCSWPWRHYDNVSVERDDYSMSTKSNQVLITSGGSLDLPLFTLHVRKYKDLPIKDWLDSRASCACCDELVVTLWSSFFLEETYQALQTVASRVSIDLYPVEWPQQW